MSNFLSSTLDFFDEVLEIAEEASNFVEDVGFEIELYEAEQKYEEFKASRRKAPSVNNLSQVTQPEITHTPKAIHTPPVTNTSQTVAAFSLSATSTVLEYYYILQSEIGSTIIRFGEITECYMNNIADNDQRIQLAQSMPDKEMRELITAFITFITPVIEDRAFIKSLCAEFMTNLSAEQANEILEILPEIQELLTTCQSGVLEFMDALYPTYPTMELGKDWWADDSNAEIQYELLGMIAITYALIQSIVAIVNVPLFKMDIVDDELHYLCDATGSKIFNSDELAEVVETVAEAISEIFSEE